MDQQPDKPEMTTIGHRPSKVAHLGTTSGVYVQCRLPSGEDVYVPLKEIFALFEKELVAKLRQSGGEAHGNY